MGAITIELLRQRAEHNEGLVSSLEEVALHQQNIEKIELLGHACRHLRILYLQNNLIGKLENLHRLKERMDPSLLACELEYLNLAMNNITRLENLRGCESLEKLDLTVNFVPKAGLLDLAQLRANVHLRELYLLGNPCADWDGYRALAIASVPQLRRLDGLDITAEERAASQEQYAGLRARLEGELAEEGASTEHMEAQPAPSTSSAPALPQETGRVGEDGELRRPWCPATRVLEHREAEAAARAAEAQRQRCRGALFSDPASARREQLHEDFPPILEGAEVRQRNEGRWDFALRDSDDGRALLLDVVVGPHLDLSAIRADVQPLYARLLIKDGLVREGRLDAVQGRLLQLRLPQEVRPDASSAQRSTVTGRLLLTMPKELEGGPAATACFRAPRTCQACPASCKAQHAGAGQAAARGLLVALVTTPAGCGEDCPPL